MKYIEPFIVSEILKKESGTVLLDVREEWEYNLTHIEGSLLIPLREIQSRINELIPETKIFVLCHHGFRSLSACEFLYNNGFEEVYNIEGGIERWADDVDNSLKRY